MASGEEGPQQAAPGAVKYAVGADPIGKDPKAPMPPAVDVQRGEETDETEGSTTDGTPPRNYAKKALEVESMEDGLTSSTQRVASAQVGRLSCSCFPFAATDFCTAAHSMRGYFQP